MVWKPPKPISKYTALGVFIFSGGFTIGMSEVFNIVGHLEDGMFGVKTFKANFPSVPVWIYPDRWPREKFRQTGVDVIYGNPPCSPWSPVGRSMRRGKENWRTDPNVDSARRFIEYGLDMQPKIWIMESVPQIQRSEFLLDMAQIWMDNGYAFTLVREDAKFFGLPQQRRRCFMVAHRVEIPWHLPEVVYDGTPRLAGDALEEVREPGWYPNVPTQHQHYLPRIPPGRSMREEWNKDYPELAHVDGRDVPVRGRPLLMIHRIDPTIPSGVIIGQNVYLHPFHDRFIGHLEAAKLCGYPDGWQWVNGASTPRAGPYAINRSSNDLIAQIAKAVTPPAARFLAHNLLLGLDCDIPAEVQATRATFWARTQRVNDFDQLEVLEPWDVSHTCTVLEGAEEPLTADALV